jgi:hypothetical protein
MSTPAGGSDAEGSGAKHVPMANELGIGVPAYLRKAERGCDDDAHLAGNRCCDMPTVEPLASERSRDRVPDGYRCSWATGCRVDQTARWAWKALRRRFSAAEAGLGDPGCDLRS